MKKWSRSHPTLINMQVNSGQSYEVFAVLFLVKKFRPSLDRENYELDQIWQRMRLKITYEIAPFIKFMELR